MKDLNIFSITNMDKYCKICAIGDLRVVKMTGRDVLRIVNY